MEEILNSPDGTALPSASHTIPLWRILISISLLIIVLLVSCILVCGTNEQCRARIPTLNNLLNSTFVAPFLITALNSLLSLQLFVSVGIYYKTQTKALYWSRLQMLTSIALYVSVVITLFVFPFTNWNYNWANITIIVALVLWMITVLVSLRRFYRHRLDNKRKMLFWSTCMCVMYTLSSVAYIVIRALQNDLLESGLLVSEIICGLGIGGFLLSCLGHIWNLQFKISVP